MLIISGLTEETKRGEKVLLLRREGGVRVHPRSTTASHLFEILDTQQGTPGYDDE